MMDCFCGWTKEIEAELGVLLFLSSAERVQAAILYTVCLFFFVILEFCLLSSPAPVLLPLDQDDPSYKTELKSIKSGKTNGFNWYNFNKLTQGQQEG